MILNPSINKNYLQCLLKMQIIGGLSRLYQKKKWNIFSGEKKPVKHDTQDELHVANNKQGNFSDYYNCLT